MLGTSRPSESILAQESRQHLHLILAFEEMGGVDGWQPDQFGAHLERVLDSRRVEAAPCVIEYQPATTGNPVSWVASWARELVGPYGQLEHSDRNMEAATPPEWLLPPYALATAEFSAR